MSDSVLGKLERVESYAQWKAWLVCLSAGLFFFYEFFQLNLFDVINQPLRDEFHLDAVQISWMSSTYLWADVLFLLPAGLILDRYSPRTVILSAMSICIVGTVGFALAHSFALACFFHFLSGIGNAFCFLSCIVLISRWFPPRRQALVIGCVVTMAFIGGMMAHTPLAYLNAQFGWRDALLIDGVAGIALFLWIAFIVKDHPKGYQLPARRPVQLNFLHALRNPQNWLAGLYTSCLNLPIMVLCALWGANYLETVHQLSTIEASNLVTLIFVGSIVGCPLAGWVSDTMGKRKPLMVAGAIATLIVLIPLMQGEVLSKGMLSTIFFLLGFFTSTQVVSYPLIAESNSQASTGSATGFASILIMGGAGVGQVIFGKLIHWHATSEHYAVADFQFAMWLFPVAAVIALAVIFLARETHCQRTEME